MAMKRRVTAGAALLLWCAFAVIAAEEATGIKSARLTGWGAYQFGQIVRGSADVQGPDLYNVWTQQAILQTTIDGIVHERGHCLLSFESMANFSVPILKNDDATKGVSTFFYFHEVQGTYDWGDLKRPYLTLAFGYFPYKYNPDARNLGEYLFRSGTYPPFIINNFDFPMTRQLGAHVTGRWTPYNGLDLEGQVLVTSESQQYPTKDFTLTCLPKVTLGNGLFEFQGGVSLARFLSVDKKATQPKDSRTLYLTNVVTDTAGFIVSADSGYYTFAGTKLMGRFSLDPLKSLRTKNDPTSLLWKNDLRLYGEAAILGLKNYPKSADQVTTYDTLSQRIPVMLGINLPTHQITNFLAPLVLGYGLEPIKKQKFVRGAAFGAAGLLWAAGSWLGDRYLGWHSRFDLISFEWEWYGWKYPDDYRLAFDEMVPIPSNGLFNKNYSIDDHKWSLYIKKDFLGVFSLRAELARDHLRPVCNSIKPSYKGAVLTNPEHWFWMCKIFYGF